MNLGKLTSTRGRRAGILILVVAAAGVAPLVPTWTACVLAAGVVGVLGKAVLEARVAAESSVRAVNSAKATFASQHKASGAKLTRLAARVDTSIESLTAGQRSARTDMSAVAARVSDSEKAQERLASEIARTQQQAAKASEASSTRLERLEDLTRQITASTGGRRQKSTGLGRGLDVSPEAKLADAIARLSSDFAG